MLAFFFSLLAFLNSFWPQATFVEGIVGQPKSLNVLDLKTNQPDRDLSALIHRSLMKYDEKGNLVPDLAESYEVSADVREFTFKLRQNLHWHDGKEFDADDVLYTVSRLNWEAVSVDKLDNHKVRFKLAKSPHSAFLDLMTQYILRFKPDNIEKPGLSQVGLGDFRLGRVVKSDKVDQIILVRAWPWSKPEGPISRIVFKFFSRGEELAAAARLGQVDTFGTLEELGTFTGYERRKHPLLSRYYGLYFNLKKENLKDKNLRLFLTSSLPKEEIIKEVFALHATAARSPLDQLLSEQELDQDVVSRPLRPLNLKNKTELTLTIPQESPGLKTFAKTAALLKSFWAGRGLEIKILAVPADKILSEVIAKKNFELLLYGQEINNDPDVYSLWHSTQKDLPGLNFTSYASVLADKILEESRQEQSAEARTKLYKTFIKLFREDPPAVFIYHPLYSYYFKEDLVGPDLTKVFFANDRFLSLKSWRRF